MEGSEGQCTGCVVHMDMKVCELMTRSRIEKMVRYQDVSGRSWGGGGEPGGIGRERHLHESRRVWYL